MAATGAGAVGHDRHEDGSAVGVASPRTPVWFRAVATLLLGTAGTIAAVRGWGPVVMSESVQVRATAWILGLAALFVLGMLASSDRSSLRWAGRLALLIAAPLATAANAGRGAGFVAALGVIAAHAGVAERPARISPVDDAGWFSLVLLSAGHLIWVFDVGMVLTVAVLVAAFVVAEAAPQRRMLTRELTAAHDSRSRSGRPFRQAAGRTISGATAFGGARFVAPVRAIARAARDDRRAASAVVLAALGTAALVAPIFHRYATQPAGVLGFGDYEVHLDVARGAEWFPLHLPAPHPLFHMGVASMSGLFGQVWATTVVLSVAVALTVLVLVWLARTRFAGRPAVGLGASILFAVGYFVVESPAMVASALRFGNPNDWAPMNHMYLSPTDTLLIPLAITLVVLIGRVVHAGPAGRNEGLLLAVASVLTMLAKPSITIPLLAAVPAYLVLSRRVTKQLVTFLAGWFVLPSVALLGWQTWFLETGASGIAESELAIRPMETIRMVGLDQAGPLLFLPALVVPICLWAGARRYLREPTVAVSLLAMAVSIVVLFLFNETGERVTDGTFTKPAFISWVMVHIFSWRFLLGEAMEHVRSGRRRPPLWAWPAAAMLLVGAVGGVLTHLEAVGLVDLVTRAGTA